MSDPEVALEKRNRGFLINNDYTWKLQWNKFHPQTHYAGGTGVAGESACSPGGSVLAGVMDFGANRIEMKP